MKRTRLSLLTLGAMLCTTAAAEPQDYQVSPQTKPAFQKSPSRPVLALSQDLEVTAIGMAPSNPVAGQVVRFEFTLTNKGTLKSPEAEVVASFWDTRGGGSWGSFQHPAPKLPPLDPGQTQVLKTDVVFITLGDEVGVSVTVDRDNKINETDETNNEKRHFFSVACKPDLSPFDYREPIPPTPRLTTYPNQVLKHTVWVYNNGWCHSKPATLSVVCRDLWPISVNIPPINGRQRVGLPVSLAWPSDSERNCIIQVDAAGDNDESIENNNRAEIDVMVVSDAWPKP